MQKIATNKCYGGFGLSEKAMLEYAKLKGMKLFPEKQSSMTTIYWTIPKENRVGILSQDEWGKASIEQQRKSNKFYQDYTICDSDLERDDPDLISVIELLGESASGQFAKITITEIPEGIAWEIQEYDGMESVSERHRSW